VKSIQASRSDHKRIHQILDQLQRNRNEKQFIEFSLKGLIWVWVTFPLPAILISSIKMQPGPPNKNGSSQMVCHFLNSRVRNFEFPGLKGQMNVHFRLA